MYRLGYTQCATVLHLLFTWYSGDRKRITTRLSLDCFFLLILKNHVSVDLLADKMNNRYFLLVLMFFTDKIDREIVWKKLTSKMKQLLVLQCLMKNLAFQKVKNLKTMSCNINVLPQILFTRLFHHYKFNALALHKQSRLNQTERGVTRVSFTATDCTHRLTISLFLSGKNLRII